MLPVISISVLVLIFLLFIISSYNKLNTRHNQIENAKSSLDALFLKRNDLIPNLITVTTQYMNYEKKVLNERLTVITAELGKTDDYEAGLNKLRQLAVAYAGNVELNSEIVNKLIERIETRNVLNPEGKKAREINIIYRFINTEI